MYYNKYLKYKSKYLNLLEMNGGGYKTAKTKFISSLNKDTDSINQLLLNDQILLNSTIKDLLQDIIPNAETIFDYIFEFVNKSDTKNPDIDWIINSYLNKTFGIPSSLENIGRYISARKTIDYLNNRIKGLDKRIKENFEHVKDTELYTKYSKLSSKPKNVSDFNSLVSLEEYLSEASIREIIDLFEKEDGIHISKITLQKKIKEEGESDYKLILTTDNITIYQPTSTAGSKYYGRETKWCTASNENNMYDRYTNEGPLYIIQSKTSNRNKFQFQYETKQLMDSLDTPISVLDVIQRCNNDTELIKWFNTFNFDNNIDSLITFKLSARNTILSITSNLQFSMSYEINDSVYEKFKLYMNELNIKTNINKITHMKLDIKFIDLSLNLFDKLTNLQVLNLVSYNLPLNNYLNNFTKLRQLHLESYNLQLNNSLDKLTSLTTLYLSSYNLQLNNSLDKLTSLTTLYLSSYNLQLNNFLDNLTSLIILDLSSYNLQLNNSLDKLTNLQELDLSSYNKPLNNSLNNLTSLLKLYLTSYNLEFNNSLDKLNNLEHFEVYSYSRVTEIHKIRLNKYLPKLKTVITEGDTYHI